MASTPAGYSQFISAVAATGLVSQPELESVEGVSGGDQAVAIEHLVARGLLTQFQVDALREGHAADLRIGNYDLLDRLGAGGMGTVYKARHRRMKRIVALKVLSANISKNAMFVARFQREVETIAALGHPNIVMAYDADEAEAGHFLVMEFVNGRDLAACVAKEGPLSVLGAVHCIEQAARGLAYAHEQGIVHRDIKPHNLLLDNRGTVKVTDLGLARLTQEGEVASAGAADVSSAGGVFGTAHYMPPEQAIDFTRTDHRGDIYSLGCTLYFLLTGRTPYSGATVVAVLLKHRDAPIPKLTEVRPGVPQRLDELFQRMLAKDPEDRIQSMGEVADEMAAIAEELRELDDESDFELDEADNSPIAGASTTYSLQLNPDKTLVDIATLDRQSVLLVEPSRVQASIVQNYLESFGMNVAGVVGTGKAALEEAKRLRPQAIVCSLHLPDMTGLQLAEQIHAESERGVAGLAANENKAARSVPPGFVLVTTSTGDVAADSLVTLRRVLPLTKPFTSEQLKAALNTVMSASIDMSAFSLSRQATEITSRKPRAQARVLIVDDSSTARKHIRAALSQLGFAQFTEVADGAEAIAMAANSFCDLIITDYNMPLMDGRAMVSYFKQNIATAGIPIIMVTTESEPRLLEPVRRLGVLAIVDKTFPLNVVEPILDSLF